MDGMLKKRMCFGALFVFMVATLSMAQVTVNASIDSLQLLIGEQTAIKLEVSCNSNQQVVMPQFKKELIDGVEILEEVKTDTQYLNKKERMLVTQKYLVTSFDTAFYFIPPFEVLVDSQPYYSNSLALKVLTFQVDTLHTDQIFGMKEAFVPRLTLNDLYLLLASGIIFIALAILVPYLISRYRSNKPILKRITVAPKLPPHQLALQEMAKIKEEKTWQKGDPKEYYTQLTDVIRTYIKNRFGFNAMEMTSSEIIEKLQEQQDKSLLNELHELFITSDLVKFAKHNPLMNENDLNLVNAIDFINGTKVEEVTPSAPVTEEIVVKEGRSKKSRYILLSSIVLLCMVAAACLYFAIREGFNLFF